jgi:hypothetical protein
MYQGIPHASRPKRKKKTRSKKYLEFTSISRQASRAIKNNNTKTEPGSSAKDPNQTTQIHKHTQNQPTINTKSQ